MATRTLSPITAPAILRRQQRIFRCHYFCDCGAEWNDELLVVGGSWCPACVGTAEPYCTEEFEEDRLEWED